MAIPRYVMLSEETYRFVYYTLHYSMSEICKLDPNYQDNNYYKQAQEALELLGKANPDIPG